MQITSKRIYRYQITGCNPSKAFCIGTLLGEKGLLVHVLVLMDWLGDVAFNDFIPLMKQYSTETFYSKNLPNENSKINNAITYIIQSGETFTTKDGVPILNLEEV